MHANGPWCPCVCSKPIPSCLPPPAQARLLPEEHVRLKVYGVSTHRLAAYLDAQGQLLPLIQGCLLQQMGFPSGHIRLVNLL